MHKGKELGKRRERKRTRKGMMREERKPIAKKKKNKVKGFLGSNAETQGRKERRKNDKRRKETDLQQKKEGERDFS